MEKDNKNNITPEINEEQMMNLMVDGIKKDGFKISQEKPPEDIKQHQATKETISTKQNQNIKKTVKPKIKERYGEQFLVNHSMTKRGDKSIYIRKEYHERLSRIIQVVGKDEIPLYAYLDNILQHHFKLFEDEITSDFNEHFKPLF